MSQGPHAHLMLPSPLGLLEYDVLEDAVFIGPNAKGGLRARPTPFKGACMALTRAGDGFVARPLPGEAQPLVNGEAVAEKVLVDGDRIGLGDQVALFRTQRGLVEAPKPQARPEPSDGEPRPAASRRPPAPAKSPVAMVLGLVGLVVLLVAVYRAVNHAKTIRNANTSKRELPELPRRDPAVASRSAKEFEQLRDLERRDPTSYGDLVARYTRFEAEFAGTPEASMARDRIRELMDGWSERSRAEMDDKVKRLVAAHQFARALREVRDFEQRFATTKAAEGIESVRKDIRAKARASLDQLIAKVGPLITPQPREAHRLLIGVSHEFPADMHPEVIALIERAVARMMALGARKGNGGPGKAPSDGGLPPLPKDPVPPKEGPPKPVPGPARDEPDHEAMARDAWKAARADLVDGRYAEALQGYTMLMQQHGNTNVYRDNKAKIASGRRAARAGAQGPAGLLVAAATTKRGRLEVEYQFDDPREYEEDWTQEQPFSSEMPVEMKLKRGQVMMEKASGLFHKLVFLSDVRIEADVHVEMPHDFGLIAVEDSDSYRAILFNIANTKFTLKKGAAAKVNPGHLLWYIGQGVWSAADADAHGYIKIAERSTSKLTGGDRLKLELTRRKNSATGSFQGKSDGVHLEGRVKGDDGSTMGSGRVGLFTNSGIIRVESVRISGVVDLGWFRKELEFMVGADPGPDEPEPK